MIGVIINPGTEPCQDATEENAIVNMRHLVTDINHCEVRFVRCPEIDYGEGRYGFLVWHDNRCHEIQMPGLPLERVRFMDKKTQDAWQFKRLYVDGSSWLWCIALDFLHFGENSYWPDSTGDDDVPQR